MKKIVIDGGQRLDGRIEISGMKNSALPIIFACLLIQEECILENIPRVSDVENALLILRQMGAEADFVDVHTVKINAKNAQNGNFDFSLISKMRASSYLLSTCVSRFGSVCMPYPGGCNFGARPIDQHIKGLKKIGAKCTEQNEILNIKSKNKLKSNKITLDKISVGATINMIMATVLTDGQSIIENVAKEPHVFDLIRFLNTCGADILHFGSHIRINGVAKLKGSKYRIFSDTIETLTFITCVGVTGGKLALANSNYEHIKSIVPIFQQMNMKISNVKDEVYVSSGNLFGLSVSTAPYPGFPTDLHPQFSSLLCYCKGGGSVTENIFAERFAYIAELEKMGAKIKKHGNTINVNQSQLVGACLDATDLRAGAALVVAALGAKGVSTINNVNYIVRGYEELTSKLSSVGGNIKLL